MPLDPETCYRALLAHDSRFDGCFFVGVTSTGIYCRPICRVKTPQLKNCRFFSNAAAAESCGFRPCLRCRPELAPGHSCFDSSQRIAHAAAALLESGSVDHSLADLANQLHISPRHLRRVFQAEFGATPIEFAKTQRLLLAKRLLTDTALPITQVAFASGFRSVRRFHATLRERYRLTPSQIRKTAKPATDVLTFDLSYRPPYDWPGITSFLAARSIPGVEAFGGRSYRRTLCLTCTGRTRSGWIEIALSPRRDAVRVVLSSSLLRAIPAVLAKVKHVLDLGCNPAQIGSDLGAVASARPGLRVPGAFDGFEIATRAILGQ
ncbi:MAG: helix-turn-helix domain-containing protein, partial [Acidobacteriaceae bacterium]|nr:helix-turn-helix domain-containing protein [Acidobacteriaceae bacterium]